jgi:hypothetical protein
MLLSSAGIAHETHPFLEVVIERAKELHHKTPRMERLQREVFEELGIEKQHPMYFVDARRLLNMNIEGVCFPADGKVILMDTHQFKNKRYTDLSIKLTMAHEILHCYAGMPHIVGLIEMEHLIPDGDIYKYENIFQMLDVMVQDLLNNDQCPASLMFPNGGYDAVCGPLMYEIYMDEAREALRRK